jgi:hypothetical protein
LHDDHRLKAHRKARAMDDGSYASERELAWGYSLLAIVMTAAGLWLVYLAHEEAAEAVRLDGMNVDAGSFLAVLAMFYLFPNSLLWVLAALSIWRRWEHRWVPQGLAAFCRFAPVLLVMAMGWKH